MKRLSARLGTVLFVLLAASASQVRADYMSWTYTASPNVPGVTANASSPAGGASVAFTGSSTPQTSAASIAVLTYTTSIGSSTGVLFGSASNTPPSYSLALKITDGTTHDSGTLTFKGTLSGLLTQTSSSVVASFKSVGSNSLTLDGHTYTVNIPSVTLAAPNSPQGDIFAKIQVSGTGGSGGGPPIGSAPEPASLMLGILGFSCFGFAHWGKRRFTLRFLTPIA